MTCKLCEILRVLQKSCSSESENGYCSVMKMAFNSSGLHANNTLLEVTKFFNISLSNLTNQSVEKQVKLFTFYEALQTKEQDHMLYTIVAYIVGTLIILSNSVVVISSGLILSKGQQPKSTYMLLGNVSLADTIVGVSIIIGSLLVGEDTLNSNIICIFHMGMLVCPAMVSIFSVGLIAIDRYIYILHGLYYQRLFNTTKVRVMIVCIWMIGITLSFLPALGWRNPELINTRCFYVGLYPGALILLNSLLSIVPIIVVAILYSIILIKALKNVKSIRASDKYDENSEHNEPKLRIYRGNTKKADAEKIKRSASCGNFYTKDDKNRVDSLKSKSINDLINYDHKKHPERCLGFEITNVKSVPHNYSDVSVYTIDSSSSGSRVNSVSVSSETKEECKISKCIQKKFRKKEHKPKEPNKWRAIIVVMLTSGSFILTWLPFFITVIFFVFCEEKTTNVQCLNLAHMLGGPLATLAFFNSVLNPLIYAWWHKGFKKSIGAYCRKFLQRCFYNKSSKL